MKTQSYLKATVIALLIATITISIQIVLHVSGGNTENLGSLYLASIPLQLLGSVGYLRGIYQRPSSKLIASFIIVLGILIGYLSIVVFSSMKFG